MKQKGGAGLTAAPLSIFSVRELPAVLQRRPIRQGQPGRTVHSKRKKGVGA